MASLLPLPQDQEGGPSFRSTPIVGEDGHDLVKASIRHCQVGRQVSVRLSLEGYTPASQPPHHLQILACPLTLSLLPGTGSGPYNAPDAGLSRIPGVEDVTQLLECVACRLDEKKVDNGNFDADPHGIDNIETPSNRVDDPEESALAYGWIKIPDNTRTHTLIP